MASYSYFRSTDLSALLMLEQQFAIVTRQFLQRMVLSLVGLLAGFLLLVQGIGLLGLLLLGLSAGLGLWSNRRYHFKREYLWLEVNRLV